MRIFDLSLRHKLPLWGSLLIVATTLSISTAMLFRAYDDLRQDRFTSSAALGQSLAKTLFPTLLHDDLWHAFEIVRAPLYAEMKKNPLQVESIFVVDAEMNILVASNPKQLPTLAGLDRIDAEHRELALALRATRPTGTRAFDFADARHYFVAVPIAEAGRQLGTLVVSHGREAFWMRFLDLALRGVLIGVITVAVILPINWYWGRRMAEPLVDLAAGMDALMHDRPAVLPAVERYAYHDELGRLFVAYRQAAVVLNEKALLEQEVMHSERLAAVGRLAAGIAHEVNNPLGGMLMSLDTLKQRGPLAPHLDKTVDLLERGLRQVAETVGALLVEARVTSRPLVARDLDDVRTLLEPQAIKKALILDWPVALPATLPLPANQVRQVLINLLLNAIQATEPGGRVGLTIDRDERQLALTVANSGVPPDAGIRVHLFEPFVSGREGGHGLGLWVTYQTVTQLGGQIHADWTDDEVRFTVTLPLERAAA